MITGAKNNITRPLHRAVNANVLCTEMPAYSDHVLGLLSQTDQKLARPPFSVSMQKILYRCWQKGQIPSSHGYPHRSIHSDMA